MKKEKKITSRQKAQDYVSSGQLRSVLEMHSSLDSESIDKLVNAACFGLGV